MKSQIALSLILATAFTASAQTTKKAPTPKVQRVTITVDNGFKPSNSTLKAGVPAEITFDTKHRSCARSVVFKELSLSKTLSDGKKTVVKFTPKKPGTINFACQMGMFKSTITVK